MEKKVGIDRFMVSSPGVGGRLKRYPEDFIVEEELDYDRFLGDGDYILAKVWSRNWETNRLIRQFSRALGISRERIKFSGTKDKRAVTTQWISFDVEPERLNKIHIKDVEICEIKKAIRLLHLGAHTRNRFKIIIRDMDKGIDESKKRADVIGEEIKEIGGFPNWFGVQRFGTIRPITHEVGRALIEGDFKKAFYIYVANPMDKENEICREARQFLEDTNDYREALKHYPNRLTFEKTALQALVENPGDYQAALSALPNNLLKMFIHAHQSYIFNKILSMRMERGLPLKDVVEGDMVLPSGKHGLPNTDTPVEISSRNLEKSSKMVREGKGYVSAPLFGLDSEFSGGEQGEIERKVLKEEGFKRRDFTVPSMRFLSSKGTRRPILASVDDLKWGDEAGGLMLSFSLYKGCYATCLLREFMKLPSSKAHLYS